MSGCNATLKYLMRRAHSPVRGHIDGIDTVAALGTASAETSRYPAVTYFRHPRPRRFAAVDFFWFPDAWNPEDPSLTSRTQTLL